MDIGQRIKEIREGKRLSQNALARKSGAAQSAICEIEAGKRQPTYEVLEKIIVSGFDMSLPEFFTAADQDSTILPPDIWALVAKKENFHILRKFIELQLKGISDEIISEWLHSLDRTITALKKQYDHPSAEDTIGWVAEEPGGKYKSKLTEEEKQAAIEKFKKKLDDPNYTLKWNK